MRESLKNLAAATLVTAAFAMAPALFAATPDDTAKNDGNEGSMMQGNGQMGGKGMMHAGQMPMMKMMSQMNEMMATCNKMMQAKVDPSIPSKAHADKG